MGSEGVGGRAGNLLVPLVAGWPDGLHVGPRQQPGQGCYCCYGDRGEDCYCCCCSQAGWHHCRPAPRGGRSEGLCKGTESLTGSQRDKYSDRLSCIYTWLTINIQHWLSRLWPGLWATAECVPAPVEPAAQPEVIIAPETARWPGRRCRETGGQGQTNTFEQCVNQGMNHMVARNTGDLFSKISLHRKQFC